MHPYESTAGTLRRSLNLAQEPVAMSFLDSVPPGLKPWQGPSPAGCRFWEDAAQEGIATSWVDHASCSIGLYTHNLSGTPATYSSELNSVLNVLGEMQYVRPEDIPAIPVVQHQKPYVVYAPLATAPAPPDVVLLFVNSQQSLIVTEAVQQVDPGVPFAMGRPACAIIPQVINSGVAAMSLGCCGARAYLDVLRPDIALWGLPGGKIDQYAERIGLLSKANDILGRFHALRRQDIENGKTPSYQESLMRLQG